MDQAQRPLLKEATSALRLSRRRRRAPRKGAECRFLRGQPCLWSLIGLPVTDTREPVWKQVVDSFFSHHLKLVETIKAFGDERLEATVPGRTYNFYRLFQSTTQHAVYHAGQIALLKKNVPEKSGCYGLPKTRSRDRTGVITIRSARSFATLSRPGRDHDAIILRSLPELCPIARKKT